MSEVKVTVEDTTTHSKSQTKVQSRPHTADAAIQKIEPQADNREATKTAKSNAIAATIGSSVFNYTTSNLSKWTNNPNLTRRTSNALTIVGYAALAKQSLVMAAVVFGLQLGKTAIDNAHENTLNERSAQVRRIKAGYNSLGEVVGRRK